MGSTKVETVREKEYNRARKLAEFKVKCVETKRKRYLPTKGEVKDVVIAMLKMSHPGWALDKLSAVDANGIYEATISNGDQKEHLHFRKNSAGAVHK